MGKIVSVIFFIVASVYASDVDGIVWTEKTFFKKNWYEAFYYCIDEGARLPTNEEAYTLPQSENDVFAVGLNYIQARGYERKVVCVKDKNQTNKAKLIRDDIYEIKKACGYDVRVEEAKVDGFSKQTTGDKIKSVATDAGSLVLRGAVIAGGVATAVASGGLVGGGIVELGLGTNSNEMRTTSSICENVINIEKKEFSQ